MKSIKRDGLKTPIDLLLIENGMMNGRYALIAGAHRLQACKNLGWKTVPAKLLTRDQARGLAEIENIVRSEPTVLDKSIAIVRYAKELRLDQDRDGRGGQQPHDRGISRIARETGWSRKRIAEAYAHDSIRDTVKERLYKAGLADNGVFLAKLVKLKLPADQKRLIRDRLNGSKKARDTSSDKKKIELESDVERLTRIWKKSYFCKSYERETKAVQQAFLRSLI